MSLGEPLVSQKKSSPVRDFHTQHKTQIQSAALFKRVAMRLGQTTDDSHLLLAAQDLATMFHGEFYLECECSHRPADDSLREQFENRLRKAAHMLYRAGATFVQCEASLNAGDFAAEQWADTFTPTVRLHLDDPGENGLSAWFGTPTQRILRRAIVPTLVIKPLVPLVWKPILCIFDFSDAALRALKQAIVLARTWNSPLFVLHVMPPPQTAPAREGSLWHALSEGAMASKSQSSLPESFRLLAMTDPDCQTLARQHELDQIIARLNAFDIHLQTIITSGATATEALAETRKRQCGLLIVSRGPRFGLTGMEVQTPAEALADVADIPVLVFPNN